MEFLTLIKDVFGSLWILIDDKMCALKPRRTNTGRLPVCPNTTQKQNVLSMVLEEMHGLEAFRQPMKVGL